MSAIFVVDVSEGTSFTRRKSWRADFWRDVRRLPRCWEFSTASLARSSSLCCPGMKVAFGS